MPHPTENFLKVYEDMIEVLIMLKVFLAQYSEVEYLLNSTSFCSEIRLLLSAGIFWHLQHYIAWQAQDGSGIAFSSINSDHRMLSPCFQILVQISVMTSVMVSTVISTPCYYLPVSRSWCRLVSWHQSWFLLLFRLEFCRCAIHSRWLTLL